MPDTFLDLQAEVGNSRRDYQKNEERLIQLEAKYHKASKAKSPGTLVSTPWNWDGKLVGSATCFLYDFKVVFTLSNGGGDQNSLWHMENYMKAKLVPVFIRTLLCLYICVPTGLDSVRTNE